MLAATIVIALATVAACLIARLQLGVYRQQLKVYQQQLKVYEQQSETSRRNLKFMLFERRLRVFEAVIRYMQAVEGGGTIAETHTNELRSLLVSTSEVDFLFPPLVREYLETVMDRGANLPDWMEQLTANRRSDADPEKRRVEEEKSKVTEWFRREIADARARFNPYLNFEDL